MLSPLMLLVLMLLLLLVVVSGVVGGERGGGWVCAARTTLDRRRRGTGWGLQSRSKRWHLLAPTTRTSSQGHIGDQLDQMAPKLYIAWTERHQPWEREECQGIARP